MTRPVGRLGEEPTPHEVLREARRVWRKYAPESVRPLADRLRTETHAFSQEEWARSEPVPLEDFLAARDLVAMYARGRAVQPPELQQLQMSLQPLPSLPRAPGAPGSGFNPLQPRDWQGQWVETGAEQRQATAGARDTRTWALREAMDKAEAGIVTGRTETAVGFDRGGAEILRKSGGKSIVEFTDEEAALLREGWLTHNHPSGWDYAEGSERWRGNSFSDDDVYFAVSRGLDGIRVVTPGYAFEMTPDGSWPTLPDLMRSVRQHNADIERTFYAALREGTMTYDEANARHHHELWLRVAPEVGMSYRREPRKW